MARYDRIAPLRAPARAQVFSGWKIFLDLEGRERDAEVGRRARVRFLALRPLLRVLRVGLANVTRASLERQIDAAREELGQLPARDYERGRMAALLHALREQAYGAAADASLEIGAAAQDAGHEHAAREFYAAAAELATRERLPAQAARATYRLGLLELGTGRREHAAELLRGAAARALDAGEQVTQARALTALAALHRSLGSNADAEAIGLELMHLCRSAQDPAARGAAAAALARRELHAGSAEQALELAWTAVRCADDEADRTALLCELGVAFARLGLRDASERCFRIALARASDDADRLRTRSAHARAAAEAGAAGEFRSRRAGLLAQLGTATASAAAAEAHLDLARGALRVPDAELARDHLRATIALAKRHNLHDALSAAEELIGAVERAVELATPPLDRPGAIANRIAAALEAATSSLVPAGG